MVQLRAPSRGDERGTTIVLAVLLLTAMMAIAALVVDLGYARQKTRQSQGAADAAALAGAQDLPRRATSATYAADLDAARNTAVRYLASDLSDSGSYSVPTCPSGVARCSVTVGDVAVTVTAPYSLAGSGVRPFNLIHVRACRDTPTFFGGVIGQGSPRICRSATARKRVRAAGLLRGLVALDPHQCQALTFSGNSETILHSNGAVIVESDCASTSAGALDASGASWEVDAGAISVVGTATLAPCDPTRCTEGVVPETGAEPIGDPLGDIAEPAVPATTFSSIATACPPSGVRTFTCLPGRYTFSLSMGSNDTYLFQPGIYYLDPSSGPAFDTRGGVSVGSEPSFPASAGGPLFFIKRGNVEMNGTGAVALRPYATRPWQGMTFFQDRAGPGDTGNHAAMVINGTADFHIGTVYAPEAHMKLTGAGGGAGVNVTGQMISRTAELTGSVNIDIQVVEPPDIRRLDPDLGLEE